MSDWKRTRKKTLSILLVMAMLFSMFPAMAIPVFAQPLPNGANLLKAVGSPEWKVHNGHIKGGDRYESENGDQIYIWQDYAITDPADQYRIDHGEYKVSAQAYFEAQASSRIQCYIEVSFWDANGNQISYSQNKKDEYSVGPHKKTFSVKDIRIPSGTRTVQYKAKNNCSLDGRVDIRPDWMKIEDDLDPVFNILAQDTADGSYRSGTGINYQMIFSEPVNVTSAGYLLMNNGGRAEYTGQTADKTTLNYTYTIPAPESGTQMDAGDAGAMIKPSKIMGVTVQDDASHTLSIDNSSDSIQSGSIFMDNKPPVLTDFVTDGVSADSCYKAGESITLIAKFHEYVKVTGTPTVAFSNGSKATAAKWQPGDNSTKDVEFTYTIAAGENSENLRIDAIDFTGIVDVVGQDATESPSYAENIAAAKKCLDNLKLQVDTMAPIVAIQPQQTEDWVKGLAVTVSASDNIAGVKTLSYDWVAGSGGTPTFPPSSNIRLEDGIVAPPEASGTYRLYIQAKDGVGNESVTASDGIYRYDKTAPALTIDRRNIPNTDVLQEIKVTAEDIDSGVSQIVYDWLDAQSVSVLKNEVNPDGSIGRPTVDGRYSIVFQALDRAGNEMKQTEQNVYIDAVAPTIAFTPDGASDYCQSHTVRVTAEDEKAGVDSVWYQWTNTVVAPAMDDAGWTTTSADASLTTPAGVDGSWYLHIKARDRAGNVSVETSNSFPVDNAAPTVTFTPDGNAGDVGREEYEVGLVFSDGAVPVTGMKKEYVITEREETPLEGFQVLPDGQESVVVAPKEQDLYLHVRLTDAAGNVGQWTSKVFAADTKAPTGSLQRPERFAFTNQTTIPLALTGTDDHAKTLSMRLTVDGVAGEWKPFTSNDTVSFTEVEGPHTAELELKDEVGNISEKYTVSWTYDHTPPVVQVDYSTVEPTNQPVAAVSTATDNFTPAEQLIPVGETSHTFAENGTFVFTYRDQAGNEGTSTAVVSNIDLIGPTLQIETEDLDGKRHQRVEASIAAADPNGMGSIEYRFMAQGETEGTWLKVPENGIVTLDGVDGSYRLEAKAQDRFGNETTKEQSGFLLDNTAPEGEIEYVPAAGKRTAQNVEATLIANEPVTITAGGAGNTNTYLFTDNGSFTFRFHDEAGNEGTAEAAVDWIDRNAPLSRIDLQTEDGTALTPGQWVSEPILVRIVPPPKSVVEDLTFNGEPIESAHGITLVDEMTGQYRADVFGVLAFETRDVETGISSEDSAMIRVDEEAPEVTEVRYSNEGKWTNRDVTVTIQAEDTKSGITYVNGQTHTFTENGSYTFIIEDGAGNQTRKEVSVNKIDKTPPTAVVTYQTASGAPYTTEQWTNENVIASLSFPNEPASVSGVNGAALSHTFTDNGSYEFLFVDEAGNSGSITAAIDKIDRIPPSGFVSYDISGWTNQDVTATLHGSDDRSGIIAAETTHVFKENGSYVFRFTDGAGNPCEVKAEADRIDKTPPVLSYTLSPSTDTRYTVYAFVEADEPVTFLNNGGRPSRSFKNNGNFVFRAADRAGNVSELDVVVENITNLATPAEIVYSTTEPTSGNVIATIQPKKEGEHIYVMNNNYQKDHRFRENGEFTFIYSNDAGVSAELTASVTNIDRTKPELQAEYSTTAPTKEDVTVTVHSDKDVKFPYGMDDGKLVMTENGTRLITVTDRIGNQNSILVKVNWIDKEAPVISVPSLEDVVPVGQKDYDLQAGVTVADNVGLDGNLEIESDLKLDVPGDYTVTYRAKDAVGNVSEVEKHITVYDPNAFNLIVNSKMARQGEITVDTPVLQLEKVNPKGSTMIKYLPDKQADGAFKTAGTVIKGDTVTLPGRGYYTIYALDDERQAVLIYVFVQ